ncbi:MAG: ABC transporter ATP-binding protein [Dehalococcoidia bacterium]
MAELPEGSATAIAVKGQFGAASLLDVSGLTVTYGRIQAVRSISLVVPEGSIVSLIGANGAGKTSTLSAIAGLLRPRSGSIRFAGEEVDGHASHDLVRRGLVLIPEGRQILAQMSVAENLELGAYQRRDQQAVRQQLAGFYARFPVLAERRHLPAGSLSGGEQQMLAIARGLMARPRLLLLDEPSMGLAPLMVNEVFRLLREIQASGTTILLVEQNARKALTLSSYAYVLQSGRIVLEGTGVELLSNEALNAAYLGTGLALQER